MDPETNCGYYEVEDFYGYIMCASDDECEGARFCGQFYNGEGVCEGESGCPDTSQEPDFISTFTDYYKGNNTDFCKERHLWINIVALRPNATAHMQVAAVTFGAMSLQNALKAIIYTTPFVILLSG